MTREQHAAFLDAIERHKGLLYKIANTYCQRRDDRGDLIQDIVLELWKAWPSFDGRAAFATWMYRVAVNVAISAHRGDGRRVRNVLSLEDFGLDVAAADRIIDAEGDDLRALRQLIGRLDPLDRALILMYLEGYAQDEIASTLGLSATNVGTRVNRIKHKLQREHAATETAP